VLSTKEGTLLLCNVHILCRCLGIAGEGEGVAKRCGLAGRYDCFVGICPPALFYICTLFNDALCVTKTKKRRTKG
jgi:hypothetical protein